MTVSPKHLRIGLHCIVSVFVVATLSTGPVRSGNSQSLEGRAVWASAGDAGTSRDSVAAFAERLKSSNVNTVVMCVKGVWGEIYWPSEEFSEAVRDRFRDFDMPAALIEECHKRGIEVHAWFCDFPEGGKLVADDRHPEWAMRNPDGDPTSAEILRGRPYGGTWMCPAQRPGYTDQYLIPMIVEFAKRYDVDAIHHDYVRYPGDLAPDTYCFCDYCLENIPKFAGLYWQAHPDEEFYPNMDRPHLEAHWEPSPRALPMNWQDMSRKAKSRFLLDGGYFHAGNNDLDYFFYLYRVHWIQQFVREVSEEVRKVKPNVEFSAAVFKNPVQSGRFIGQDWRGYSDWVQYAMPMNYRDHIPGDFETHLDLMEETVRDQLEWARDFEHLWIGICDYQLYPEENRFSRRMRRILSDDGDPGEMRELVVPERVSQPALTKGFAAETGHGICKDLGL